MELARDLPLLEAFSATHNNLTGEVPCPRSGVAAGAPGACPPPGGSDSSPRLQHLMLSFNRQGGSH